MHKYDFFVAHQYSKKRQDDLRKVIEDAFEGSGLKAYYADEEPRSSEKMLWTAITEKISSTKFGIYDITDTNINVYLELGFALGKSKTTYIVCEHGINIPTDLGSNSRIEYESYLELTKKLKKFAEIEKGRQYSELAALSCLSDTQIISKSIRFYEAEGLPLLHRYGSQVGDLDAHNGKAWFADSFQERDHIIYGPYENLPCIGGKYTAIFKMKTDDNSSSDPILTIDLGHHYATFAKTIHAFDFKKPDKYQLFSIEFCYHTDVPMEYRVMGLKRKVWIDYIAIIAS